MKLETKTIETKRLILRPFIVEDAPAVFETWASDANNLGVCDVAWYAILKSDYQKEHTL